MSFLFLFLIFIFIFFFRFFIHKMSFNPHYVFSFLSFLLACFSFYFSLK